MLLFNSENMILSYIFNSVESRVIGLKLSGRSGFLSGLVIAIIVTRFQGSGNRKI